MNTISSVTLSEIITILAVLMLFWTSVPVGRARSKHGIKAPAMTGHEDMDRAVRVHMNSLEQYALFLPMLWIATMTFQMLPWLPAALGLVWIIGRFIYMQAYLADPSKRSLGFTMSLLATAALIVISIVGIAMNWNAGAA